LMKASWSFWLSRTNLQFSMLRIYSLNSKESYHLKVSLLLWTDLKFG
jgi:hypothetical protein